MVSHAPDKITNLLLNEALMLRAGFNSLTHKETHSSFKHSSNIPLSFQQHEQQQRQIPLF